ncbi:MAG: hypothetical protein NTY41_17550 [Proteobacteria bacterium]|nr:hypothetical protein [Pseudomonadota bacterium]
MKSRYHLLAGLMTLCLLSFAGRSGAKELIFNMGYGKVQVIDVIKDELLPDIAIKGWAREAVSSGDKRFLYVTASRHMIHKIDLLEMRVVHTIDMHHGGWDRFIFGMELVEDGKTAYVHLLPRTTSGGEAVVGIPVVAQIDLETGQILRSIEVPFGVIYLAYVKNTKTLYALGQDITMIDVSGQEMKVSGLYPMFDKNMNILPLFSYPEENNGVALLPYWIGEAAGLLRIDKNTGKITEIPIKDPMMVYSAIYSPDMKTAYANMDELFVIDLETRRITNTVIIPNGTAFSLMTSADGKKIYLQGGATITIYDTRTLKVIKELHMSTDGALLRRVNM